MTKLTWRHLFGNADLQVIDNFQWVWARLVYLTAKRVRGVTTESMRGRGEVEVQPEGESKRVDLTEGARLSGKGK